MTISSSTTTIASIACEPSRVMHHHHHHRPSQSPLSQRPSFPLHSTLALAPPGPSASGQASYWLWLQLASSCGPSRNCRSGPMLMWRPHVSRTQDASERALFPRRRTLPRSSSLRCARLALWSSPPTSPSDLTGLFNNTWTKKASKVAAAGA